MTNLQNKYKEKTPQETINNIKLFFEQNKFKIKENNLIQSEIDTWSCRIDLYKDEYLILSSNGKGMTKDYCLASGYAEVYERFCNRCLDWKNLFFNKKLMDYNKTNYGYYLDSHEKELNFDDIISIPVIKDFYFNQLKNHNNIKKFFNIITNEKSIGLPFKNLFSNEIKYFDPRIIIRPTGSNGMAAGNTIYEALNQGLAEFFERQAEALFFQKPQDKYYQIDKNYINNIELLEKINNIERLGYKYYIFDLSYNFNYPTLMALLIAPNMINTSIKFSSFPVLDIAIERLITEIYQGIYSFEEDTVSQKDCMMPWREVKIPDELLFKRDAGIHINFFPEDIISKSLHGDYNKNCFINNPQITNEEIYNQYYKAFCEKNNLSFYYYDSSLSKDIKSVYIFSEIINPQIQGLIPSPVSQTELNQGLIFLEQLNKTYNKIIAGENVSINTLNNIYNSFIDSKTYRIIGNLMLVDFINPLSQLLNINRHNIFELDYNNKTRTIFTPGLKKYITLNRYIKSNKYTKEEIINIFKDFYNIELIKDDFTNINNIDYLLNNIYNKTIYDFYYCNFYKDYILTFKKKYDIIYT